MQQADPNFELETLSPEPRAAAEFVEKGRKFTRRRDFGGARLCGRPAAGRLNVGSCRIFSMRSVMQNAKLLRLVSATQPRSAGIPRVAAFASFRLNTRREPASQTASSRTAAQSRCARFGRMQAALVVATQDGGRQARLSRVA